ncbi:MAG: UDP-N-acetylmuramate--L-alanine ligase [Patescibacteria group bacterium]
MENINIFFNWKNFYLVGIKGVAMTSTAQLLLDAGKGVRGSDVAEDFVTKDLLADTGIIVDVGFESELPTGTDCLIYTSAHGGPNNPQVLQAQALGIPCLSQAEALSIFFNQKKGVAVCGVGGKSTVSAMIAWILEKTRQNPSYSVGVGRIPGLARTGKWNEASEYFIAEADEYVTNPQVGLSGQPITPRFSFLKPYLTVCTNLKFDHPDVYRDFEHTKDVFTEFFRSTKNGGQLIINGDNPDLRQIAQKLAEKGLPHNSYGESENCHYVLRDYQSTNGRTYGKIFKDNQLVGEISLQIPGKFNLLNALAAVVCSIKLGTSINQSTEALKTFNSTMRRFEFVGENNGVLFYDDYAHHPHEVASSIQALNEWYPDAKKVIAFQSHTYSRTKKLFDDFMGAFKNAQNIAMIEIFASAREGLDPTVSSDLLCQAIKNKWPEKNVENLRSLENLAGFFANLEPGSVVLTVGAGDIYLVYEKMGMR